MLWPAFLPRTICLQCRGQFPVLDFPCTENENHGCWYCAQRCSHCMRAAAGILDNDPFKFCSSECYGSARKPPAQPQEIYLVHEDGRLTTICSVTVQPPRIRFFPCCAAISSKHEKFLHIYVRSKTKNGKCMTEELALCHGHFSEFSAKRLYVVYHMRSLPRQVVTESHAISLLMRLFRTYLQKKRASDNPWTL